MDLDAALFRSAISSDMPESVFDVLSEGQRICAAVSEAHNDGRVRLSTRVLEMEYGEMRSTTGMQAVMDRAAVGPRFVDIQSVDDQGLTGTKGDSEMRRTGGWRGDQQGSSTHSGFSSEAEGRVRQWRSREDWQPAR